MKNSITPNQIKQNNRNLIYRYIYENEKVSQQDICFDLRLSRPTVTANLNELENDGLIVKCGQINTEYVGRKASAYSVAADYRVSIGVEILKGEVKIIAVDLYGNKINRLVYDISYENNETYYKNVCDKIIDFKNAQKLTDKQILGIGFAMQALVAPDGRTVIYGKILACTGLSIDVFTKYLPYPCSFIHDADSAAISELWASPELTDGFYLSVSRHLGAAIICDRKILSGKHGHNATIEHIQINPDGALCYCGKKGCMDTLCSLNVLLHDNETLDSFFSRLRSKDPECIKRWDVFLSNLAKSINMLHLIYDTDFILGGYLAPYLCEEDLISLHEKICRMTPFSEEQDFIRISKMPKHNTAIGAALPYVQKFLDSVAYL